MYVPGLLESKKRGGLVRSYVYCVLTRPLLLNGNIHKIYCKVTDPLEIIVRSILWSLSELKIYRSSIQVFETWVFLSMNY